MTRLKKGAKLDGKTVVLGAENAVLKRKNGGFEALFRMVFGGGGERRKVRFCRGIAERCMNRGVARFYVNTRGTA